jgi:nitrous oxidase accessory protein NosD
VAAFDPFGEHSRRVLAGLVVVGVLAGAATIGAFVVDPAAAAPEPVSYDDTVELGLSSETDVLMRGDARIPRVQVFYSQLQYVVGYTGVESFVATADDGRTETQFGYPLVVYVETFDDGNPNVTGEGYFMAERAIEWVPAGDATYVVGSDARSPAGETVVPFASRQAATAFAADHGGRVTHWEAVRRSSFDVDSAATVRSVAPARWEMADERIAAAARTADRPVSVVVGEDQPTIAAAVDAAPPNTTVAVPPGTYTERVVVNRSITIAGHDAAVLGNGTGSVITVRAPNVTLSGLYIEGAGTQTRDPETARRQARDDGSWDTNIQLGYGYGDAGIRAIDAPGLFVDDVTVETNASGILLRAGSDAVVRALRVDGSDDWRDGFMGITAMESQVTVTDSVFDGGRDGIYAHRADGSIVRNSTFRGNRYGTHLMYTGDALIADNTFRDARFGGITVMTRPSGNAIVGNDVRRSGAGIQASGTRAYIAYNTLAHNGLGFSTSSRRSVYEHNVVVGNEEGAHATTVVPSSRVVANDFFANDRHAIAGPGALRVWAAEGRGNYWEGAAVGLHEPGSRAYRPTSTVDAALHREVATAALRESPAVALLDGLYGTVPGARSGSISDPDPATEPFAPARIAVARSPDGGAVHADWRAAIASADTNSSVEPATRGAAFSPTTEGRR